MSTKAKYRGGILNYFESSTQETTLVAAPLVFAEDFLGSSLVIPAAGSAESGMPWVKKIVGAAPPTAAVVDDETNGVLACTLTSASEKQNAEVYCNDVLQLNLTYGLVFEARFQAPVLPTGNAEIVLGLVSAWADGLDAATYSAFFTLDGSGEIFCESDDNATDSSATSGVTLTASDWAIVRLEYDSTGLRYYVNGIRVASATTFAWAASASNSKVQPIVGCYKASGTGVGTLYVDYVRVWQNRS